MHFKNLPTIVAIQVAIAMLVCGASLAREAFAQLLERKVTLVLTDVSLETALKRIEAVTDVRIFYSIDQLGVKGLVSVEAREAPLRAVLDTLLVPHDIQYKVDEKKHAIFLKREAAPRGATDSAPEGLSQARLTEVPVYFVTGTVTDGVTQQPMAGVNAIVKGTTTGTTTDGEGRYSLQAEANSILVFSFIGYSTYETPVDGRTVIDVLMFEDVQNLKAVEINAGYYNVTEREKTGSISRVTAEVIEQQPVTNPLAALQGRVPGLFIQQTTGTPGGDFNIELRGRNSLRSDGNSPLFVIDGVPFSTEKVSAYYNVSAVFGMGANPLTSLNPADIANIEVLKDADATAIYGSRGANGVILITTKKGQRGKTNFTINADIGAGQARHLKRMNTQQYLEMRKEAFVNDGITVYPEDAYDVNGTWDTTRYTNWSKVFYGTAKRTSIQTSLSGGEGSTQFAMSARYLKETSVVRGDFAYQKGAVHLSVQHSTPDKRLDFSATVSGNLDKNNQLEFDLSTSLPPNAPAPYDENGELNWENSTWKNPLAYFNRTYDGKTYTLLSNTTIGYEILQGFHIKSSIGYNRIESQELTFIPSSIFDPALGITSERSTVMVSNGRNGSWIVEPQLTYERMVGRGKLSVLSGATLQGQSFEKRSEAYSDFPSNNMLRNLRSAARHSSNEFVKAEYRYAAIFGRINYNWSEKYILNLTARRDGSSRFGPGRRFANFGAIGAAWLFSNESFVENNLALISFGKLRASYGITGSDQIGNYQFLDTYSTGSGTSNPLYQGVAGLSPLKLFNPYFAWETNRKLEGALELGLWNDRIWLSIAHYVNRSSDQLVNYTLPMTTGFSGILANLPATVQNTGIEVELSTENIKSRNFNWTTSLNIAVPNNKLIAFPNIESSTYANTYIVGQSIYIQKFYESTGVDPETGLWTFRDFNGDGVISRDDDQQMAIEVGREFFGGLNNTIRYRNWSLEFFFQFVKQTGFNFWRTAGPLGYDGNWPLFILKENRWKQPGDVATIQRLSTEYSTSGAYYEAYRYAISTGVIGDASFIRLKNVALSYHLPKKWTKNANCKLYAHAQNLLMITSHKGYDPETQSPRISPLRMVTVGFNVTL